MAETEPEPAGLSEERLAAIELHVARRHAAGAFHGHTADGQWWSVLDDYLRDTTALAAEVRRLRAVLEQVWLLADATEPSSVRAGQVARRALDDTP